ncbi:MAG: hypothetical protein CMO74_00260 [Verrucomicrobiales bacterium]|nr:hypothetical protein [Verrucomicrobiales bacterium]|tara:strand:- start:397 stop:627 length:231 start_codon:yes stop_codon:yes gene_type:complete
MSDNLEMVADAALALEPGQRASLAHKLIASLDEEVDEGVEAAWLEVIERRVREVESGEAECRPVEEVLERLRQRLA